MIGWSELFWVMTGAVLAFCICAFFSIWKRWKLHILRQYVSEEEEPDGEYKIVRKMKTPFHKIALVKQGKDWLVFGNGMEMFGTAEDENKYAEALVHIPMALAQNRQRVLIIGAGGGITTREALKYPELEEITAVDIDAGMMEFGKTWDIIVEFNGGAFHHPKVKTVVQDGRNFIEQSSGTWDVVIVDLPEPSGRAPELGRLFSREFYAMVKKRMKAGGVLAVTCSVVSEMPEYFWAIQATLKSAGFHVLPYHFEFIVDHGEDWGFCAAASKPISPEDVRISVSTRFLHQDRLKDMFHIPYYLVNRWDETIVQTDQNRVLAEIVDGESDVRKIRTRSVTDPCV